jgi:polysaccharide export outer membrane protein
MLAGAGISAFAQQPVVSRASAEVVSKTAVTIPASPAPIAPASPATASAKSHAASSTLESASSDHYRIGVGDVLDIRVFNKPQFSRDGVRVDGRGMIRMPLLEGEIRAACHTEEELSGELTARYQEYLRNPQVDVFIKEYQSQPVAVLGSVRAPSRFQLQRRVRLLEMLSFVGGASDNAGRSIQVVHAPAAPSVCEMNAPSEEAGSSDLAVIDYYKLSETLRGDERANPFVRPGDIISIAEADQIYVVGNVLRPTPIALKEPVTVSRAIAIAGGTQPDTRKEKVRIIRQTPGSTDKTEIFVDLRAIDKHQAEDLTLQANDIVDVPTNSGKRLLKTFIGAVVPSVGQLPVRVIP